MTSPTDNLKENETKKTVFFQEDIEFYINEHFVTAHQNKQYSME